LVITGIAVRPVTTLTSGQGAEVLEEFTFETLFRRITAEEVEEAH
jgi:hypothetical protein